MRMALGILVLISFDQRIIYSIDNILYKGRMGNNALPLSEQQSLKLKQQEYSFSLQSQQPNSIADDPIHIYVNYRSSLPIKTFTSLKFKVDNQNDFRKGKGDDEVIKSKNSDAINSKQNAEVLPENRSMNKIKKNNSMNSKLQQITAQQNITSNRLSLQQEPTQQKMKGRISDSGFKPIKINIEQFLIVKKQPIERHYQFKEMIGEGSYGQVFRAFCRKTYQERAIKVLKTKFMKENQKKSFLSEMTLLSKINHPSIITLYDLFQFKNNYYVVMEYCKGGSIVELMKRFKRKSETIIANIMKQVLSALSYLHSINIVHRDIKLDNLVFLDKIEESNLDQYIPIKIIDFGTAVETKFKVVQNYPIAGTMSYIAPQVMKGSLSDKNDIWSSAVLMTILLTGVSPFKGRSEEQTQVNITSKHINFQQSPFKYISDQAKKLLKCMFDRNYHKRISAADALKHPWFNISSIRKSINVCNIQTLQKFYKTNNLISVVQSFLSIKKINQAERQKLANIFNEIDSDNNGVIEVNELLNIYRAHFDEYSQEEVKQILNSIDKNKSGKIDFNEFIIVMYSREKLFIKDSLIQAFQYFDKDHTGFIDKNQLTKALKGSEKQQIQYFIKELDIDKDNKISKEQFINYLTTY